MVYQKRTWSAALFLLAAVGCGETRPATYPVTVTVTYADKKPVPGAQVVLMSAEGNVSARGAAGGDGSCSLTTYQPNDGALLGKHRVLVAQPPHIGDPDVPFAGPKIAPKFANFATSGFQVEVTDDPAKNKFALVVTPR
jgi:hypothetical protein